MLLAVKEFCCPSLLIPNEEDVEFNALRPVSLFPKPEEADRYLIGDYLNSDINNFIILKFDNIS